MVLGSLRKAPRIVRSASMFAGCPVLDAAIRLKLLGLEWAVNRRFHRLRTALAFPQFVHVWVVCSAALFLIL